MIRLVNIKYINKKNYNKSGFRLYSTLSRDLQQLIKQGIAKLKYIIYVPSTQQNQIPFPQQTRPEELVRPTQALGINNNIRVSNIIPGFRNTQPFDANIAQNLLMRQNRHLIIDRVNRMSTEEINKAFNQIFNIINHPEHYIERNRLDAIYDIVYNIDPEYLQVLIGFQFEILSPYFSMLDLIEKMLEHLAIKNEQFLMLQQIIEKEKKKEKYKVLFEKHKKENEKKKEKEKNRTKKKKEKPEKTHPNIGITDNNNPNKVHKFGFFTHSSGFNNKLINSQYDALLEKKAQYAGNNTPPTTENIESIDISKSAFASLHDEILISILLEQGYFENERMANRQINFHDIEQMPAKTIQLSFNFLNNNYIPLHRRLFLYTVINNTIRILVVQPQNGVTNINEMFFTVQLQEQEIVHIDERQNGIIYEVLAEYNIPQLSANFENPSTPENETIADNLLLHMFLDYFNLDTRMINETIIRRGIDAGIVFRNLNNNNFVDNEDTRRPLINDARWEYNVFNIYARIQNLIYRKLYDRQDHNPEVAPFNLPENLTFGRLIFNRYNEHLTNVRNNPNNNNNGDNALSNRVNPLINRTNINMNTVPITTVNTNPNTGITTTELETAEREKAEADQKKKEQEEVQREEDAKKQWESTLIHREDSAVTRQQKLAFRKLLEERQRNKKAEAIQKKKEKDNSVKIEDDLAEQIQRDLHQHKNKMQATFAEIQRNKSENKSENNNNEGNEEK